MGTNKMQTAVRTTKGGWELSKYHLGSTETGPDATPTEVFQSCGVHVYQAHSLMSLTTRGAIARAHPQGGALAVTCQLHECICNCGHI